MRGGGPLDNMFEGRKKKKRVRTRAKARFA
jgi:hypothetical protein